MLRGCAVLLYGQVREMMLIMMDLMKDRGLFGLRLRLCEIYSFLCHSSPGAGMMLLDIAAILYTLWLSCSTWQPGWNAHLHLFPAETALHT